MVPAVYNEAGKKVGGGCPGMNPWHDGWKLHKLKGSVLAHFQLRVLSRAIALVRAAVVGAGGDGPPVGQALDKLRASTARGAEALAQAGLPKPGPDCRGVPHCAQVGCLSCPWRVPHHHEFIIEFHAVSFVC